MSNEKSDLDHLPIKATSEIRSGVSAKSGRPWRAQKMAVHFSEDDRRSFELFLRDGVEPFPPGWYLMPAMGNITIDRDGNLAVSRDLILKPFSSSAKKAAAGSSL